MNAERRRNLSYDDSTFPLLRGRRGSGSMRKGGMITGWQGGKSGSVTLLTLPERSTAGSGLRRSVCRVTVGK